MQFLRIFGGSILALSLALGLALPALAAPNAPNAWAQNFGGQVVKGKVISVDEGNQEFVIKVGKDEVTIKVDSTTEYFKSCVPGQLASLTQHLRFRIERQNKEEVGRSACPQTRLRLRDRLSQPENPSGPQQLKQFCPFAEEAGFSDIAAGDMVVVWLASEGGNLAERVHIIGW
jgi:hypothetical protein